MAHFKNNKMGRGGGQGGQSAPRFEPKIILSLNWLLNDFGGLRTV